jgi:hypothetical protein
MIWADDWASPANPARRRDQATGKGPDICKRQLIGMRQIDGRRTAALIGFDFIADALILIERAHARAFDRRDMDKAVGSAAIGRDKTKTLVGIEKFDCADWHYGIPSTILAARQ